MATWTTTTAAPRWTRPISFLRYRTVSPPLCPTFRTAKQRPTMWTRTFCWEWQCKTTRHPRTVHLSPTKIRACFTARSTMKIWPLWPPQWRTAIRTVSTRAPCRRRVWPTIRPSRTVRPSVPLTIWPLWTSTIRPSRICSNTVNRISRRFRRRTPRLAVFRTQRWPVSTRTVIRRRPAQRATPYCRPSICCRWRTARTSRCLRSPTAWSTAVIPATWSRTTACPACRTTAARTARRARAAA